MPRATNAVARKQRRDKVLKRAKGFFGAQKSSFRVAAHKVKRALAYGFVGRKIKKRDFRAMWNVRISAAARINGTSYSKLIHGLLVKGVQLDRKILADIALHDPQGFAKIVEMVAR